MALKDHLAYKYKFAWPIECLTFKNVRSKHLKMFKSRRFHIKILIFISPCKIKDGMVVLT